MDLSSLYSQSAGGPQGTNNSNPFLQYLQSNGGSALISGALGGVAAAGQAHANERMNAQQLGMQQNQLNGQGMQFNANDRLQRDQSLAQQAPVGWAQNYEQQTMLKNLMLQKLMNGNGLQPTNPAVAAKLQALGPQFHPTIPEEWQTANPFGVNQSTNSIQQRQGVLDLLSGGRGPGMDMSAYGGTPQQQQTADQYRTSVGQDYGNNQQQLLQAIGMNKASAGQPFQQQQQQGGGQPGLASTLGKQGMGMATNAVSKYAMGKIAPSLASSAIGTGAGLGAGLATGAATMGIGMAIPAAMALYGHLKEGPRTNEARDQFANQFNTPNTPQDYSGYTGGMGGLGNQLNQAGRPDLFNQFSQVGNRKQLSPLMDQIQNVLSGQQRQSQVQNPYLMR